MTTSFRTEPPRASILGVGVSAIDLEMACDQIEDWIVRRTPAFVCVLTAHGVIEAERAPDLRTIFDRAGMVTPDGMPLVWLSRLAGLSHVRRVYGPDLLIAFCERSLARGYRHYFYGTTAETLGRLTAALRGRFPGLVICGSHAPPFGDLTPEEDEAIVAAIRAARPDVVWVGLGTPKQERWMVDHVARIGAPALVGIGAAFDFVSGTKRQAPIWMQRSGLEWLFRLASEPRRLWLRYLVYNPLFVAKVARQYLTLGIPVIARDTGASR